ncbi:transcriptional regulator, BadM/Rrf2 family [Carnobacterium iners]|uniref:Transcriptional regulator, BadM/Rrf2 family n=1 Tax=Carnobacterium iners TaxID=1073423 RepID=A0A1X7N6S3_9LACT|nr:Rrf2 family transcriptional regulator [Carnobacterium iners]SEL28634.1 transcriptional regulator, BadM/Rrf2 family [Carnobacterium iners]SMH32461.1 transcriptional regulator, BadM/Rrf2 family [Carnobacterium iners]
MNLTKGLEQAVCIMTLLATQDKKFPIASHIINRRLKGASPSYIKKIMRKLVVNGLVTSVSGSNGGFSLTRDPESIHLLEVVEALEGPIVTYPNTGMINQVFSDLGPTADQGEIILIEVFKQADNQYKDYLSKQTLAELICKSLNHQDIPILNWNEKMNQF